MGYAIALPHSSFDRNALPPALRGGHAGSSDDIVLLMDDLPHLGESVRRIMEQWRVRLGKGPLGQEKLDRIVELVSPRDDGESIWRARIYGRDERWLKLTEQQLDCLAYIEGSARRIVLGWPGTGKTLLAMESAKNAAQRSQRCLFLTFNWLIASDVRAQLEDTKLCEVYHLHGLLREMPGTEVETVDGQNEEAILRYAAQAGFFARWDVLIVDEAQALAESWHQVLAEAFNGKPMYVFCDDTQRFGFEQGASSAQLCQIYQARPAFQLTYCLRNPYQITLVLRQMMPPPFELVCPRPRELTSLEEVVAKDLGEELERQLDRLVARGVAPGDIAVLYTYGCPQDVASVLSDERFADVLNSTVAAFRGMESRIVIFVVDGDPDSDVPIFSAYSRTTSNCVAIYGYWVLREALRQPDRVRSGRVLSVARHFPERVKTISDEVVGTYQLGIVDGARKLDIRTADVYWHPDLRCWVFGLHEDEPAGHFWEHQLLQYEWSVIVLNRTEQTPYIYEGNQSPGGHAVTGGSLSIMECDQCGVKTYQGAHCGCLSCGAYDRRELPAHMVQQLEAYDLQIADIVTKQLKIESAPPLPLSLVALGMARLAAVRGEVYSGRALVNSGSLGYKAASAILWAYTALSRSDELNRKTFADRFFRYAEACPVPLTSEQWWSIVALAFNVAVRHGVLVRTERNDIYQVAARVPK
jgi:hypothetical protein